MKDRTANKAQVEQKLVKTECDLKKSKLQINKLQDQLKRQMGLNTGGLYTAHSLDLSDRILDNEVDASSLENSDLV